MKVVQSSDYSVSISQDTKSIKDLPDGVGSLTEEEKAGLLKQLEGQMLYLDLTRPDLMISVDLSRSSSKTPDERLEVARALLIREPVKSIVYTNLITEKLDLVCFVYASSNQNTVSWVRFTVGSDANTINFSHHVEKCQNQA